MLTTARQAEAIDQFIDAGVCIFACSVGLQWNGDVFVDVQRRNQIQSLKNLKF